MTPPTTPSLKLAVIGGSGLASLLSQLQPTARHAPETPFGKPSDAILETSLAGIPVFLLSRHGPGHTFNPSQVPYRANLFALKALGVTHILATGAVGSLREEFKPRDLVLVDQFIDKTTRRPSTFFDHAAVHVDFAHPTDAVLRSALTEAAATLSGVKTHTAGTYVCMEGPAFSTRAESLMHRLWGGDVIGMTGCPEAKLAREAEIAYATIALITDFDAWKPHPATETPESLLTEILGNLKVASDNAMALLQATIPLLSQRQDILMTSPALSALKLGIWSDKAKIPQEEIARLSPLWGKYF